MKNRDLKEILNHNPCRIVVGASGYYQDDWIPTEKKDLNLLNSNDWQKYFIEDSIDAILAESVWEYFTKDEAKIAANNCFKYLKYGGYLRVSVPDGYFPDSGYIEWVKPGGIVDQKFRTESKLLHTYQTIKIIFETVGFNVILLEYFDENGKFHYKEWDAADGLIRRSLRYDERNKKGNHKFSEIILDAVKEKNKIKLC